MRTRTENNVKSSREQRWLLNAAIQPIGTEGKPPPNDGVNALGHALSTPYRKRT